MRNNNAMNEAALVLGKKHDQGDKELQTNRSRSAKARVGAPADSPSSSAQPEAGGSRRQRAADGTPVAIFLKQREQSHAEGQADMSAHLPQAATTAEQRATVEHVLVRGASMINEHWPRIQACRAELAKQMDEITLRQAILRMAKREGRMPSELATDVLAECWKNTKHAYRKWLYYAGASSRWERRPKGRRLSSTA